MCVLIRNSGNDYLFSRCSFWATTILVAPNDLNNGRELTRAYNKKQHGPETYAAVELTTDRGTATVPVARLAPTDLNCAG
jgi:hypothetical protein